MKKAFQTARRKLVSAPWFSQPVTTVCAWSVLPVRVALYNKGHTQGPLNAVTTRNFQCSLVLTDIKVSGTTGKPPLFAEASVHSVARGPAQPCQPCQLSSISRACGPFLI